MGEYFMPHFHCRVPALLAAALPAFGTTVVRGLGSVIWRTWRGTDFPSEEVEKQLIQTVHYIHYVMLQRAEYIQYTDIAKITNQSQTW